MSEKYYLYNTVTHEVVNIPDDIDGVKWISLSEEKYGDKYKYPAIYSMESHVVWDQSDDLNKNGDWMMVAESTTPSDGGHGSDGTHGSDAAHGSDGSHGSDAAHGSDGSHSSDGSYGSGENSVAVAYHHGRRSNMNMGLYYVSGTHEIGLAESGLKVGDTPDKFIPLWMNDEKNVRSSLFNAPRPGGSREGEITGLYKSRKKSYIIFKDSDGSFKKQAFKIGEEEGMAAGKESNASDKWIHKHETKKSVDLNGDGIFGDASGMDNSMSEGEHNNATFKNKYSDKKLLKTLKKGGMVVYLRHTTTEVDYADQADPDMSLKDCSTQRMLNDQGKAEAAAISAGIEANDILIGKVTTSDYCRAKDTASLALGKKGAKAKSHKHLNFLPFEDYTDEQLDTYHDRVRPMLTKQPKKGNTFIVGHDDPFEGTTGIYPDPQGTAYVIKPNGDSYDIIAQLQPSDWAFGADI